MDFHGNFLALVTPFEGESVDSRAFRALVDRAIQGGVHGIVPCGTTGESPTLSHAEHDHVVAMAVESAAGRVPIIAGAGSNSTNEAVRLTKAAAAAGAQAVLSVTPYYNKPTQEGLYAHFCAVAEASDLPVILYDIPGRTSIGLAIDTIARLARHPNIRGIKEATGNVENVTLLRLSTDLVVLSGDDSLTLPMMALGARGMISVLSNLVPAQLSRMVDRATEGNFEEALEIHNHLHPLMKIMFLETNPVPIKAALAHFGLIAPDLRLPLCPMTGTHMTRLVETLQPFLEEIPH